jgi:hypothetical protein
MMMKLSLALTMALGLPVLLASALAQTAAPEPRPRVAEVFSISRPESETVEGLTVITTQPTQDLVVPSQSNHGLMSGQPVHFAPMSMNNEDATYARTAEQLARKLGAAKGDSDRGKIKDDLTQVLEKQFDLRQKRHLNEIKSLEAKVKKLKDLVDKRQENRREIVSKRLEQIMSDAEGLGW